MQSIASNFISGLILLLDRSLSVGDHIELADGRMGIDDGENRVGGDLYLMIWDALKANNIQIPFPQREVNILNRDKV